MGEGRAARGAGFLHRPSKGERRSTQQALGRQQMQPWDKQLQLQPPLSRPHGVADSVAAVRRLLIFCVKQLPLYLMVPCLTVHLPRKHFSFSTSALLYFKQFIFSLGALCCHLLNCLLFKVFHVHVFFFILYPGSTAFSTVLETQLFFSHLFFRPP